MDNILEAAARSAHKLLAPSQEMSDEMQKKVEPDSQPPGATDKGASRDKKPNHRTRRFALTSGDRPLDGYTIKRGVGTGGFGEVYYATTDAGKEVALKRIERNLDIELRGVRHCLNLKHPNLVALFDIKYDDDEQAWVVMEFVSGKSLDEVIERNPNGMPIEEVRHWFDGIAAGVSHLHESGIVHRDLKPGNIFSDQSTVKIGDYGLSKFISCSRRSGHTQSVGTFHYMAPEVGQGRYGKEIDIYAIGIMLYEMLTGRVPYDGESSHEIIMKHLTATPVLTGIPEPYRGVIGTALAKDPAARTLSVAQMRDIVVNQQPSQVAGHLKQDSGASQMAAFAPFAPLFAGTPIEAARNSFSAFSFADEPVAQGIKTAYRDFARGWQQTRFGTFTKFAILLLAIPTVLANTRWLAPMVIVTVLTYGLYFLIRGVILNTVPFDELEDVKQDAAISPPVTADWNPGGQEALVAASLAPPRGEAVILAELAPMNRSQRRHVRVRQKERKKAKIKEDMRRMRTVLRNKSMRQRSTTLIGSWILATLVCGVAGLIFSISTELVAEGSAARYLPMCLWAIMTSAVAASGLLFVAKGWESSTGDGMFRRFLQLVVGMATGGVAWGLQRYLELTPNYVLPLEGPFEGVARMNRPNVLFNPVGDPTLACFVAFFGLLFLMIRWWRQADPIRGTRLSLWRTILSGLAALGVYILMPIPGGILIALTTSVAVQMAAMYLDHDERRLICEEVL